MTSATLRLSYEPWFDRDQDAHQDLPEPRGAYFPPDTRVYKETCTRCGLRGSWVDVCSNCSRIDRDRKLFESGNPVFYLLEDSKSGDTFWRNAIPRINGCLDWHGSGSLNRAKRKSWEKTFGQVPRGRFLVLECNSNRCINPDHLFLNDPNVRGESE